MQQRRFMHGIHFGAPFKHQHTGVIDLLLRYGANPNIIDDHDTSCLSRLFCSEKPNKNIVKLLLELGGDPNKPSFFLKYRVFSPSDPEIVKLLLEYKADPYCADGCDQTVLHLVAKEQRSYFNPNTN